MTLHTGSSLFGASAADVASPKRRPFGERGISNDNSFFGEDPESLSKDARPKVYRYPLPSDVRHGSARLPAAASATMDITADLPGDTHTGATAATGAATEAGTPPNISRQWDIRFAMGLMALVVLVNVILAVMLGSGDSTAPTPPKKATAATTIVQPSRMIAPPVKPVAAPEAAAVVPAPGTKSAAATPVAAPVPKTVATPAETVAAAPVPSAEPIPVEDLLEMLKRTE